MKKRILLTGGAGYIGSHTAVELSNSGYEIVILDNFSNSDKGVIEKLNKITNSKTNLIEGDVRDKNSLANALDKVDAVIHLAGLKAVGESVSNPIEYHDVNVAGTVSLLYAMEKSGVHNLVFSSSATVYGQPKYLPLDEKHPINATNPYGRTKVHVEGMLQDLAASDARWKICSLRYFNPVGAHESGLIGENPADTPNNLMPYIARVAVGQLPKLTIFGGDYDTPDGTGVRDYIHVLDLADGHIAALKNLKSGFDAINLGTGKGYSVLEILHAFENESGKEIPYIIANRRAGDVATCYAAPNKAQQILNWKAKMDIKQMCASAWKFQSNQ